MVQIECRDRIHALLEKIWIRTHLLIFQLADIANAMAGDKKGLVMPLSLVSSDIGQSKPTHNASADWRNTQPPICVRYVLSAAISQIAVHLYLHLRDRYLPHLLSLICTERDSG